MGVLTYTARRNVIAGHTVGVSYQIETDFQVIDDDSPEIGTQQVMLDGSVEYEIDRLDNFVALQSDVVAEANKLLWREFLTSVAGREAFTVDLTGTLASPGTDLSCILHQGRYKPVRAAAGSPYYVFNFTVRLT